MTDLLQKALATVRSWPPERQDEAAALLLALDQLGEAPHRVSEAESRAIDEGLAQMEKGEAATDAEVEAAFARFRK